MKYIQIPNSTYKLYPGSVVQLYRFPETTFILNNGYYMYDYKVMNGWYFKSIPAGTIVPFNSDDLNKIIILSDRCGCCCDKSDSDNDSNKDNIDPPYSDIEKDPNKDKDYDKCNCGLEGIKYYVRSPEIYYPGISYAQGQLVYVNPGDLYQVVDNYISSDSESSNVENLNKDVSLNKLAPISTDAALKKLEEQVEYITTRNYLLDFETTFNTSTPNKDNADNYLATLNIKPAPNISFLNSNVDSSTYFHVFKYYQLNDELEFIDESKLLDTKVSKTEFDEIAEWKEL